MADNVTPFAAGTMDKGISVRTADISPDLAYTFDTYNVTHGIYIGSGPRYGFATIPGQADNETISGTRFPGLRASEGSPAQGFSSRLKVLAVLPITLGSNTSPNNKIVTYVWVVTRTGETLDVQVSSTTADISAFVYDGLPVQSVFYNTSTYYNYFFSEAIPSQQGNRSVPFSQVVEYTSGKYYACSTVISVSGINNPMPWYFGHAKSTGDATHAPNLSLQTATALFGGSVNLGVPTEYNLQNYSKKERVLQVYTITDTGVPNTQYQLTFNPSSTTMIPDVTGANTTALSIGSVTATAVVPGTPANTKAALVKDSDAVHNTSYKAVMVASKKPFCVIFEDAYSTSTSTLKQQWIDLTKSSYTPANINTSYSEEGVQKQTVFNKWPAFIRGVPMGDPSYGVDLGPANSGILRKNTVYEFTYSFYNKRLNFETNVGSPVKIQTGDDDFVSVILWSATGTSTSSPYNQAVASILGTAIFFDFTASSTTASKFINFLQYRFYYRQEGTFEWLPALQMDAAEYWFLNSGIIQACNGPIASLPGGQPGAFNDYSNLPQDNYNCVVGYKDRAFWFAENAINFSLRNNIFAYPGRNSINAASGTFNGGIVHNYPGQAEQSSRLVIFGTKETYVARFTGLPQQTQVQVSADTSATFNIDGSDLVIDPWTSVTAFSYRSAIVAEGILYYWGPQGVYRDDGVNTPTKISGDELEPTLFTIYDPNRTDEIHASYDEQTKDITWYYPPKSVTAFNTEAIVYNTVSEGFLRAGYAGQVDWVAPLNVQSNIKTAGKRMVAGVRDGGGTIQRAFFYDLRNRSGDMRPNTDMVVASISTPSSGQRRLTLAAGFNPAYLDDILVGDTIALDNFSQYAPSTTVSNMLATVTAITSTYIDIELPAGAVMDASASLTYSTYAPFWHKAANGQGLNGFLWQIETFYWACDGINGWFYWLYTYLFFKITQWAAPAAQTISLAYRSMVSPSYVTDTVTIVDNCHGNSQRYHRNQIGGENMEGQALRYKFSGIHIGNEWVLQLMQTHNQQIIGDPLMEFEE